MQTWNCGRFQLPLGKKTYVMGIVNATPDSFSGDGCLGEDAFDHALRLIDDGADILDIGGESTRPGAQQVALDEERARVLPLLEKLTARVGVPISIDTTKSTLACEAVECGAAIINDISAGIFDNKMLSTLAPLDCGVVLMHLRGTPQTMAWSQSSRDTQQSTDVIGEVLSFWKQRVDFARATGIADNRICLDAGFGFGKSIEENLQLLRRGRELREFGFPNLSATSRKSTIGKVLGEVPVEERLYGTAATVAIAIQNGADIVRVHDVKAMAQVARITDVIVRDESGA